MQHDCSTKKLLKLPEKIKKSKIKTLTNFVFLLLSVSNFSNVAQIKGPSEIKVCKLFYLVSTTAATATCAFNFSDQSKEGKEILKIKV